MSSTPPDPNELIDLERESFRRYQAGDIDGLMDMLTENALVCPPGSEAIFGREKQRALFRQLADTPGFELSWEPLEAHVSASNDMGYVFGSLRLKMPGAAAEHGKYISIWTKLGGRWLNAVEIRNANT
ncbi:MAG: DUF4440 domain-containing protein [Gammaproteobacteria bacterium]